MASSIAPGSSTSSAYGIAPYVERAVERIERYLREPGGGEAFVVGVFGEWGSGKSTVLREIREHYPNLPPPAPAAAPADPAAAPSAVTLRVEFNAWRYEREEHLLVPLLKTIQRVVDDYVATLPKDQQPVADGEAKVQPRWRWLADRAQLLGACTIALTRMVKVKVGVPGFGDVELDPNGALEAAQKQIDRANQLRAAATATPKPARPLESLYYDLNTELGRITRGVSAEDATALNFVLLVDDLDRCLPEKAVEMLEAIKLFLDVQGCAFVLALDDEVIERGIAHRYRDYLKPLPSSEGGAAGRNTDQAQHAPPITGHEYLEKIVQLPFRLPRWSKREVREFLTTRYATPLSLWSGPPGDTLERASTPPTPDTWLVDLLVDGVPPVPRNLVRAIELLSFNRDVAITRGLGKRLQAYPVAQMVLLQLFAPQAFRFLRRGHAEGWKTFERRLRRDVKEFEDVPEAVSAALQKRPLSSSEAFFAWWIVFCRTRLEHQPDESYLGHTELPLALLLDEARHNRNGFDPRNLFLLARDALELDPQLEPYFSLFAESLPASGAPIAAPVTTAPAVTPPVAAAEPPAAPAVAPPRPGAATPAAPTAQPVVPAAAEAAITIAPPAVTSAAPRDREAFVRQLLSRSQDAWRNAITREEQLAGHTLDERTFDELLRQAGSAPREAGWLETVLPLLDENQLRQLVQHTRCLQHLAQRAELLAASTGSPAESAA